MSVSPRDGLCQWVIHNPAWVSARPVGKPRPGDVEALGRAWVAAIKGLGGYKETPSMGPVGWWSGRKKLKTVGELSGRWPKLTGADESSIG